MFKVIQKVLILFHFVLSFIFLYNQLCLIPCSAARLVSIILVQHFVTIYKWMNEWLNTSFVNDLSRFFAALVTLYFEMKLKRVCGRPFVTVWEIRTNNTRWRHRYPRKNDTTLDDICTSTNALNSYQYPTIQYPTIQQRSLLKRLEKQLKQTCYKRGRTTSSLLLVRCLCKMLVMLFCRCAMTCAVEFA